MSETQSNLSSSSYGYDLVVATTQASINAALKAYLGSGTQPEVVVCYVADSNDNPTPIDYQTLCTSAADPFSIPADADPATDPGILALDKARFMAGFKVQIGLPPYDNPENIPDVVTFGSNASSVIYNLLCSEFIVVQYTPPGGYSTAGQWLSVSQPDNGAWKATSNVDLCITPGQAPYSNLPAAIQQEINNLGSTAFSVQQLLFDLDNAGLQSVPTISGVQAGTTLYTCLQNDFMGAYFTSVKQAGQPLLGCVISIPSGTGPSSSLTITSMNFETCPLLDSNGNGIPSPTQEQLDLCTLNYLCAVNNDALPSAVPFGWNWVEEGEQLQYDGVVAINRNVYVKYLQSQLAPYVSKNCLQPHVAVNLTKLSCYMEGNQSPTMTTPDYATVLEYSWAASDEHSSVDGHEELQLKTTYGLDVTFSNTAAPSEGVITIDQHLWIYMYCKYPVLGEEEGNVVNKWISDVYTITAGQNGALTATVSSTVTDSSQAPSAGGKLANIYAKLTGMQNLAETIASWAAQYAATNFQNVPLNVIQSFVFPGGNTFLFKDACFSEDFDLVAHITYIDPS